MKSELARNKNAFADKVCEWLSVSDKECLIQDKDSVESAWERIEELIMPHVGGEKISKEYTEKLAADMLDIIDSFKYGSGIHTEDDQSKATVNNILKYFGKKGHDWYELHGRENYLVRLRKEGRKEDEEDDEE